jgi:hypothetical protein
MASWCERRQNRLIGRRRGQLRPEQGKADRSEAERGARVAGESTSDQVAKDGRVGTRAHSGSRGPGMAAGRKAAPLRPPTRCPEGQERGG